ncbi:MAG: FliM/FliN family flagellar motor switch protein [Phycisphaerae bacterium]|jgi:flagellar motor switch protein FliN/FliY|nr:FliM/FliN family flagellar motor switch protein [Phycisphaerae bacterium]
MPADLSSILRLEVPVIVQIAERPMPVAEVIGIRHGAIIELPKRIDDGLEILVNDRVIGTGTAVKVGEHFGVRVTAIGAVKDRVTAMGK